MVTSLLKTKISTNHRGDLGDAVSLHRCEACVSPPTSITATFEPNSKCAVKPKQKAAHTPVTIEQPHVYSQIVSHTTSDTQGRHVECICPLPRQKLVNLITNCCYWIIQDQTSATLGFTAIYIPYCILNSSLLLPGELVLFLITMKTQD